MTKNWLTIIFCAVLDFSTRPDPRPPAICGGAPRFCGRVGDDPQAARNAAARRDQPTTSPSCSNEESADHALL